MGLDITAYRRLVKVENPKMEDGEPVDWENEWLAHEGVVAMTEEDWPGRSEGIEAGAVYRAGETMAFRAGSYSGYSAWRDSLARVAGYGSARAVRDNPTKNGPFIELINFSDCEGVIGSVVAAKLAKDFAEHEERIAGLEDGYFMEHYREWRRAFEMASDGGAVDFH